MRRSIPRQLAPNHLPWGGAGLPPRGDAAGCDRSRGDAAEAFMNINSSMVGRAGPNPDTIRRPVDDHVDAAVGRARVPGHRWRTRRPATTEPTRLMLVAVAAAERDAAPGSAHEAPCPRTAGTR